MKRKSLSGFIYLIIGLAIGALVAFGSNSLFFKDAGDMGKQSNVDQKAKKEPLYWVAPMDANYRRDKPGKSPMGMDLVPFYADGSAGEDVGPGAVKVSPNLKHSLGVRSAKTQYKKLQLDIRTVGYVRYDEDNLINLHSRVEGWVEKLYVKANGDRVKKGQPVYSIYSPQLVNAQEELMTALSSGNSLLIKAAEGRLKSLQMTRYFINALKRSKKVKRTATFFAPQSGFVEGLKIRDGSFVKPGNMLMSIGSLDEVWVDAEVFERQAFIVKNGLPVVMTLDYLPDREWHGQVDYVYPYLDQKTRTLKVRLRFTNKDKALKPNMFAQVLINASNDDKSLVVPREAVIRVGKQNRVVLSLGDGRYKSIAVRLGRVYGDHAEVLDGLNEGDEVVVSAQFLLDSESSKTSDFKRLYHAVENDMQDMDHDMNEMDHGDMKDMDHGDMKGMNHDMKDMDHGDMKDMDHSKMPHESMKNMDHGDMKGMDHSNMKDMDHSKMPHESMKNMDHGGMKNMDHDMNGMNHDMKNMDHDMKNMDHSKMPHESMKNMDGVEPSKQTPMDEVNK